MIPFWCNFPTSVPWLSHCCPPIWYLIRRTSDTILRLQISPSFTNKTFCGCLSKRIVFTLLLSCCCWCERWTKTIHLNNWPTLTLQKINHFINVSQKLYEISGGGVSSPTLNPFLLLWFLENLDSKMRVSDRHGCFVEVGNTPVAICAPRGVLGLKVRCGHGALLEHCCGNSDWCVTTSTVPHRFSVGEIHKYMYSACAALMSLLQTLENRPELQALLQTICEKGTAEAERCYHHMIALINLELIRNISWLRSKSNHQPFFLSVLFIASQYKRRG